MTYNYDFFTFKEIHLQTHKDQAIICASKWFFGCDKPTITDFKNEWYCFPICRYIVELVQKKTNSCTRFYIGDTELAFSKAKPKRLKLENLGSPIFLQKIKPSGFNTGFQKIELFKRGKYYFMMFTETVGGGSILCFYFE